MSRLIPWILALMAVLTLGAGDRRAEEATLPRPAAPYAVAAGDTVKVAFRLPPIPPPRKVQVLRAAQEASSFAIVAELDAQALQWVDEEVRAGGTYVYAIRTMRGQVLSEISPTVEVVVGGHSRVTLIGGSLERALFEVVMFRSGRRLTQRFVHKPGEAIGDLAWVDELDSVADFRRGLRLAGLALRESVSAENQRSDLRAADGSALADLAGEPLELDFLVPGRSRETLVAAIIDGEGRETPVAEGESLRVD